MWSALNRGQPVKLLVIASFDVVREKIGWSISRKLRSPVTKYSDLIRYIERNFADYIRVVDLILRKDL